MKKINSIYLSFILATGSYSAMTFAADLIYTANQNDNTVSVIDATSLTKVADLVLGYPAGDKNLFSPLYNGQINVHGLSYSPQRHELSIASTVTNAITRLNTQSGIIKDVIYLGRNPHEPRYNNDGSEIWVTVRGENHVAVIDSNSGKIVKKIELQSGPGMVTFSNDGKLAFVTSSFDNHFWVVDSSSKEIKKELTLESNFSPFITTTPDGKEVWIDHKDLGKVTRIDTESLTVIETFPTGKISNHLAFANSKAYITIGGENVVKVYDYSKKNAKLIGTIIAGSLPHGIWNSTDGKYVYFVNELSDTMQVIDTNTDVIIKKIAIGALPQALVYAENATNNVATMAAEINKTTAFRGPKS